MKNFIIGMLIIGACIVVGCMLLEPSVINRYGASSGPDHYNMEYFHAGFTDGGEITTLSAASTTSITAGQACKSAIINFPAYASGGAASTTLPSAATMNTQCLMVDGASKTFLFQNTSVASDTAMFLTADIASSELLMPEGADIIIDGKNSALVTITRISVGSTTISITELVAAD